MANSETDVLRLDSINFYVEDTDVHNNFFRKEPTQEIRDDCRKPIITNAKSMLSARSYASQLDSMCQVLDQNDINFLKSTIDILVKATTRGSCFLEKVIVKIIKSCLSRLLSDKSKVEDLLKRVLSIDFNRYQMSENLSKFRMPIEHIVYLLHIIKDLFDYKERNAIEWLSALYDSYFVELTTCPMAYKTLDEITSYVDHLCRLNQEAERTKNLIRTITDVKEETNTHRKEGRVYTIEILDL